MRFVFAIVLLTLASGCISNPPEVTTTIAPTTVAPTTVEATVAPTTVEATVAPTTVETTVVATTMPQMSGIELDECEKADEKFRDLCLLDIAERIKDPSVCDKIVDERNIVFCKELAT